jgi:hypothetical protein
VSAREFERRRLRVYIAGPISKGDTFENVMAGIRWGRRMLEDGFAPYVPHLDAYMTLNPGTPPTDEPSEWNALLEWDLEWVSCSDALFRISGESTGADLEAEVALSLGIPVYEDWDYAGLKEYARSLGLNGKRAYA